MNRMEEFLKSSVLENLCDIRLDDFEYVCNKELDDRKTDGIDYEQNLLDLFRENVKDEEKYSLFIEYLNKFENCIFGDITTSVRRAYKLGFIDGHNLKKEIAELQEEIKNE